MRTPSTTYSTHACSPVSDGLTVHHQQIGDFDYDLEQARQPNSSARTAA
jgi:hypothetical protein